MKKLTIMFAFLSIVSMFFYFCGFIVLDDSYKDLAYVQSHNSAFSAGTFTGLNENELKSQIHETRGRLSTLEWFIFTFMGMFFLMLLLTIAKRRRDAKPPSQNI